MCKRFFSIFRPIFDHVLLRRLAGGLGVLGGLDHHAAALFQGLEHLVELVFQFVQEIILAQLHQLDLFPRGDRLNGFANPVERSHEPMGKLNCVVNEQEADEHEKNRAEEDKVGGRRGPPPDRLQRLRAAALEQVERPDRRLVDNEVESNAQEKLKQNN